MGQYGACLGYFFGPLLRGLPRMDQLTHLRPEQAIFVRQFLSAQLEDGEWPLLGRLSDWDSKQWPVPRFRLRESLVGKMTDKWIIRMYDDNLNFMPDRWGATDDEVRGLPEDGTSYGGALQLYLAELLRTKSYIMDPFATLMAAVNDPPRHFLYFHDKELADHAAEACRELGYDPVFGESVDEQKPWLVLVQHKNQPVTDEQMERAAKRIAAVAAEWGGEYDGWDRPASSDSPT
jgi:hypothetical protein